MSCHHLRLLTILEWMVLWYRLKTRTTWEPEQEPERRQELYSGLAEIPEKRFTADGLTKGFMIVHPHSKTIDLQHLKKTNFENIHAQE